MRLNNVLFVSLTMLTAPNELSNMVAKTFFDMQRNRR